MNFTRHEKEINRYTQKNQKVLYITSNQRNNNITLEGKVDTLVVDLKKISYHN